MDFGLLGVGEIESLLSALQGFNLGQMAANLAQTGIAHSVMPPGMELASATATGAMQAQVAELDALCQASGANLMAYLSVSQANKVGAVATDMAAAAPFAAV
ncbi:hypothetical protein KL864_31110 [Mycolicibacterium goodii]|uniref:hypothetical protein n=1 Tax=Mycolicibacterium goodii TaxID=134601 RepID=UPI001BDD44CF|nr:hypothetical protein [Mycolicibacterium goodii]MBU8820332.1 hypothetical protein [Mycolicibacterium goodii]